MERKKTKYTDEYINNLVANYRNGEFKLIKINERLGEKSKINVLHIKCGRILENQTLSNLIFLNRGCKYCNSNRMDSKKILDIINSIDGYKCLKSSNKVSKLVKIKHLECNSIFDMRAADFIYNKHRCPKCYKSEVYTDKKIKRIIEDDTNNEYTLLDIIKNKNLKPSRWKVHIKHNICGSESTIIFHNFNINHQRCKECSKSKLKFISNSKGSQIIKKFLDDNNISYEQEKTFEGLKYKRNLRLDFYIPSKNIAIEFDGKQHFETNRHNKIFTTDRLEETKKRDLIKNKYCIDNNISLIRFNYKQAEDEILSKLSKLI